MEHLWTWGHGRGRTGGREAMLGAVICVPGPRMENQSGPQLTLDHSQSNPVKYSSPADVIVSQECMLHPEESEAEHLFLC